MLWLNYQQTAQVCQSQTGLCVCVCAGCYTAQCRWCSRWPYWEIWRSWQVGSASPSFISSVVSLETSPLPCSCPTELRWVLHMNTCMHGLTHKQMKWTHIDSKKKNCKYLLGGACTHNFSQDKYISRGSWGELSLGCQWITAHNMSKSSRPFPFFKYLIIELFLKIWSCVRHLHACSYSHSKCMSKGSKLYICTATNKSLP